MSLALVRRTLPIIATVGLLVWNFVTGTPPRRRALAVGAPIAICYLLAQVTYKRRSW